MFCEYLRSSLYVLFCFVLFFQNQDWKAGYRYLFEITLKNLVGLKR